MWSVIFFPLYKSYAIISQQTKGYYEILKELYDGVLEDTLFNTYKEFEVGHPPLLALLLLCMFWYDDDDDDDDVDLSLNTKFYFMYDVFIVMVWWWLWIIFTDLEIQQKLLMKFRLIVLFPYLVK